MGSKPAMERKGLENAPKAAPISVDDNRAAQLARQYGCGPVRFAGNDNALYERHLVFDNVVDPASTSTHDRYEALARSVRDILSQR